jgi:hypothetical protein
MNSIEKFIFFWLIGRPTGCPQKNFSIQAAIALYISFLWDVNAPVLYGRLAVTETSVWSFPTLLCRNKFVDGYGYRA